MPKRFLLILVAAPMISLADCRIETVPHQNILYPKSSWWFRTNELLRPGSTVTIESLGRVRFTPTISVGGVTLPGLGSAVYSGVPLASCSVLQLSDARSCHGVVSVQKSGDGIEMEWVTKTYTVDGPKLLGSVAFSSADYGTHGSKATVYDFPSGHPVCKLHPSSDGRIYGTLAIEDVNIDNTHVRVTATNIDGKTETYTNPPDGKFGHDGWTTANGRPYSFKVIRLVQVAVQPTHINYGDVSPGVIHERNFTVTTSGVNTDNPTPAASLSFEITGFPSGVDASVLLRGTPVVGHVVPLTSETSFQIRLKSSKAVGKVNGALRVTARMV